MVQTWSFTAGRLRNDFSGYDWTPLAIVSAYHDIPFDCQWTDPSTTTVAYGRYAYVIYDGGVLVGDSGAISQRATTLNVPNGIDGFYDVWARALMDGTRCIILDPATQRLDELHVRSWQAGTPGAMYLLSSLAWRESRRDDYRNWAELRGNNQEEECGD